MGLITEYFVATEDLAGRADAQEHEATGHLAGFAGTVTRSGAPGDLADTAASGGQDVVFEVWRTPITIYHPNVTKHY